MTDSPLGRVVEIAENGRHLAKDRGFLTVLQSGQEIGRVPLDDLAAVLATAPGTTVSCVLIAELAARGVPFAVCGAKFLPAAILWPCEGHFEQQRRMEAQVAAAPDEKARLWSLLVSAKVARQGMALARLGRRHGAFERLAERVQSGDATNIEAQAARRYWPLMFGKDFRRDQHGVGINILLNYGYAILRAATARAVVAGGLHPGIGLFHRHPRNAMPLVDDLMEPFRPNIDLKVAALVARDQLELSTAAKHEIVSVLSDPVPLAGGTSPLSTALHRLAQSLSACFTTGGGRLALPLALRPAPDEPD